jgi:hypothetical protein
MLFFIPGAFAIPHVGRPASMPIGVRHVQQCQSWMPWNLFAVMLSHGLMTLPDL